MLIKEWLIKQKDTFINDINNMDIDDNEKTFRISRINSYYKQDNDDGYRQVLDMYHEIKAYKFLKNFEKENMKLIVASDSKRQEGPDFQLGTNYIECVNCHDGNNTLTDIVRVKEGWLNINHNYIMSRLSNSINVKYGKFKKYNDNKILNKDDMKIIFISLSELTTEYVGTKRGEEILKVLIGLGDLSVTFKNDKFIGAKYLINKQFQKNDNVSLDAILFKKYKEIDGIIYTEAKIYENYNSTNTFFYINPFTDAKFDNIFPTIITWKKRGKNYTCYLNNKKY